MTENEGGAADWLSKDEDLVVMQILREALKDASFRRWRIERYGRQLVTDDGTVYEIQDDGQLVPLFSPWPRSDP